MAERTQSVDEVRNVFQQVNAGNPPPINVRQQDDIRTDVTRDGDTDAVVVNIKDTGDSSVVEFDRYKHTIIHGLGRVPVGCQIIMADKECSVYVESMTSTKITVRFTTDRADINLRIW